MADVYWTTAGSDDGFQHDEGSLKGSGGMGNDNGSANSPQSVSSGGSIGQPSNGAANIGSQVLNGVQTGLDVAGLIPGLGEVADGLNAGIYAARGDYVGAGLSIAAMIPIAGWFATGGKLATKGGSHLVYEGLDVEGIVRYVGITGRDAAVRFGEHLNSGTAKSLLDYRVIDGATGLTKTGARVWEQTLIIKYGLQKNGGMLLNKINSIAPQSWGQYGIK